MESSEEVGNDVSWPRRWDHLQSLLTRSGPLAHQEFEASADLLDTIRSIMRVLVIGAGGLGCELLKDLALMGFSNLDVIDMDTIDLSNLNRQFLFRHKDIGKSKAEVAAAFVNNRVPGCNVTSHFCKIQDYDESFYRKFHVIVCGLDSIVARRWMNGMLISLLNYDDEGNLDQSSIIPLVDGGTEGFKGNARVILPGVTACIECTLDLFPPQVNFPLCTIAHTPRLPEHCVEYVRILQWPKENPWGEEASIDGDDPQHLAWIYEKAQERADQYGIRGVTYRLTQGVVKRIIPAVASTNAVIAASCATEVFKLASSCASPMNSYMMFNDADGVFTYTYEPERLENCIACSQKPQPLELPSDSRLESLIQHLKESAQYQMRSPGVTTVTSEGNNRTLYISNVASIEERTRPNLKKTLTELDLQSGQELVVADVTSPNAIVFKLVLTEPKMVHKPQQTNS